jgi:hypothetical protein
MRTLAKLLLLAMGSAAAAWAAGLLVARRLDEGSAASDEFRRVAVMNGIEFRSLAGGLRRGRIDVLLGGAMIDLREAKLDPAGAEIVAENTVGGLAIVVREDWAVSVDDTRSGGAEVQVEVADPSALPEDAPRLHVKLRTRAAGSAVTTSETTF